MSIKRSFVERNMLTKRKRLGWLGWVTIVVTASFLLALGLWAWRTMTQQPAPLEQSPIVSNSPGDSPSNNPSNSPSIVTPSVSPAITNTLPSQAATTGETPKTWVVFEAQDRLGQEIWDAPPEIKAWVVRDYLDTQTWTDSMMFDLDVLNAQLDTHYTDKRLVEMRAVIDWEKKENKVIAISKIQRLPYGTQVSAFSQDGLKATVLDYQAAGQGQAFDLTTHKPLQANAYPNSMHMTELYYDGNAHRWKIAHERMIYDLDSNQVLWREDWDSAK